MTDLHARLLVVTDLHVRLLAEIERRETIARFATEGPWAIWRDLDHQGFITVGNEAGVIPEGEVYTEGEANPTAHVYIEEDAAYIALHDPADALRGYAEDRDVLKRHYVCRDLNCVGGDCHTCRDEFHPCPEVLSVARRLGVDP